MKTFSAFGLIAAVLTLAVMGEATSSDVFAKSKTKKVAETIVKVLPISKPAKFVTLVSIRAYDRAGWEAGRLTSTIQHGQSGDPGRYPGYNN